MKTIRHRAPVFALGVALALVSSFAMAQTTPSVQGTSVADPAIPVLVTPAPTGSGFFVLNQDFTLMQHSLVDSSQNVTCNGPGIFSRTNPAPRTLVADQYNAYFSGPDGLGLNTAVDAITPEVSCTPVQALDYTGGLATQSVATNDPQHGLYYLVRAFGGASVDQLLALTNLNNASVSSTNKLPTRPRYRWTQMAFIRPWFPIRSAAPSMSSPRRSTAARTLHPSLSTSSS